LVKLKKKLQTGRCDSGAKQKKRFVNLAIWARSWGGGSGKVGKIGDTRRNVKDGEAIVVRRGKRWTKVGFSSRKRCVQKTERKYILPMLTGAVSCAYFLYQEKTGSVAEI